MSIAPRTLLRESIVARMAEDFRLVALLARDPEYPLALAIFNAHKNEAPQVYPCVTYRIDTDMDDARFGAEPGEDTERSAPVADITLLIEAWTNVPDSEPIDQIAYRLNTLFHQKAWDIPGLGRIFKSRETVAQPDLHDNRLNASFGLFRYYLRLQK